MTERGRQLQLDVQRPRCPYCKDEVAPSEEKLACDGCMAWHHAECWSAHGACSACGAATVAGRSTAPQLAPRPAKSCAASACTRRAIARLRKRSWCEVHAREVLQDQATSKEWTLVAGVFALMALGLFVGSMIRPDNDVLKLLTATALVGLFMAWSYGRRGRDQARRRLERLLGMKQR